MINKLRMQIKAKTANKTCTEIKIHSGHTYILFTVILVVSIIVEHTQENVILIISNVIAAIRSHSLASLSVYSQL